MKIYLLLVLSAVFIASCTEKASNKTDGKDLNKTIQNSVLKESEMLAHVRKAINPTYVNWVLFSNGTYIILADTILDKQQAAIDLMKEYGPVYAGSPAGDFSIISLNQTVGWSVTSHCYGMYTYVHPNEMETEHPTDIDIGFFGRSKREKDGKDLKIIHIN